MSDSKFDNTMLKAENAGLRAELETAKNQAAGAAATAAQLGELRQKHVALQQSHARLKQQLSKTRGENEKLQIENQRHSRDAATIHYLNEELRRIKNTDERREIRRLQELSDDLAKENWENVQNRAAADGLLKKLRDEKRVLEERLSSSYTKRQQGKYKTRAIAALVFLSVSALLNVWLFIRL